MVFYYRDILISVILTLNYSPFLKDLACLEKISVRSKVCEVGEKYEMPSLLNKNWLFNFEGCLKGFYYVPSILVTLYFLVFSRMLAFGEKKSALVYRRVR